MATQKLTPPQVLSIPIEKIDPSPFNPRKTFVRINELAASITQQGIQQPLIVRPKGKRFELVCGERRLRASQKAKTSPLFNGKDVPAIVRDLPDELVKEFQIVENLQRQDLHPMEEAETYEEMLKHPDYTIEKLCIRTGQKRSYVEQRRHYLKLITPLRKMFLAGEINADQALQLCRVLPETQAELLKYWDNDIPKASEIATILEQNVFLDLSKAPFPLDRKDLDEKAGACTDCLKHTGANSALFADIKKGDFCLDGPCFQRKSVKLIQIELKTAKDEKRELVPVSTRGSFLNEAELKKLPTGTLSRADHFTTLTKKGECKHATEAIVVDGDNFGKKIFICCAKDCPDHGDRHRGSYPGTGESEKERADRLRKERQEKASKETRRAILVSISKAVTDLGHPELQQLGRALFSRLYNDLQRKVLIVVGWAPEKKKSDQTWEDIFEDKFNTLKPAELNKTLVLLSLATLMEGKPHGAETDALMDFAERYKVPVQQISKEIEEKYFPTKKAENAEPKAAGKKKAAAK